MKSHVDHALNTEDIYVQCNIKIEIKYKVGTGAQTGHTNGYMFCILFPITLLKIRMILL